MLAAHGARGSRKVSDEAVAVRIERYEVAAPAAISLWFLVRVVEYTQKSRGRAGATEHLPVTADFP